MKNHIVCSAFIIALTVSFFPVDLNAQGRSQERPGRSGDAPGRSGDAAGVPIDGGASVLLAAGAAYGLKKLRDYRKQNNQIE